MIDFGQCLRHAQSQTNTTSAELARRLGVHRQQVNIWRNKKNVRLDTFVKVSTAMNIPYEEFLAQDFVG
jgi:transcriptional regulator with XRE-family HTH domain